VHWSVTGELKNLLRFDAYNSSIPDVAHLTDSEAEIVKRLCETPRYSEDREGKVTRHQPIPYDPNRRDYSTSNALDPLPQERPPSPKPSR